MAAAIALVEILTWRRKPATLRALHWIAFKLAMDGATAATAHAALVAALSGLSWFHGVWPPLVAGLAGSALLRSQLALLGSGQEAAYYGPANAYVRLQKRINQAIDDICAVTQTEWVTDKIMPKLRQIPLSRVEEQATTYLRALDRITEEQCEEQLSYIRSVVNDLDTKDDDKYRAVIQRLLDTGGRRFVKSLGKERPRIPNQAIKSSDSRHPTKNKV
ncbi:hypothetical protein I0C86_38485 [Plantactinospora sp. S1510]|uniref:SMODS and SLOG-associating 2TM effector domain-containing protein n=1 Tax=Plantactinospora alkalitolerans TaxID=2789879 RepID=A0ABS0H8H2_9ACTN|nr:hypothetical protein [Plantactinospora alkalitolerans]MBF9134773.1 hypothetical protein [Plantactinospora alkalitolerans]